MTMLSSEKPPLYYANGARVATSTSEFTLDFWWTDPDSDSPRTLCRIVLSPYIAKGFTRLMQEQLQGFEQAAGEIPVEGPKKPLLSFRTTDETEEK